MRKRRARMITLERAGLMIHQNSHNCPERAGCEEFGKRPYCNGANPHTYEGCSVYQERNFIMQNADVNGGLR